MPEYTRVVWTSELAKQTWEPRFAEISAAWEDLELRSVEAGLRPSALRTVAPDQLPSLTLRAAGMGLVALPLGREGALGLTYQASAVPAEEGRPWTYRVAYCRPEDAHEWARAWATMDNPTIGRLLGYPSCCGAFFQQVWSQEYHMDTTWPMGLGDVTGAPEGNILLRWINVRLVPHLPCRHDCEETAEMGRRYLALMRTTHPTAAAWIEDVLSWPMEWSALHGIAEIKTPVCKISTATDATAEKLVVRRQGTRYPVEGASGVQFPYQAPAGVQLTKGASFKRSIAAVTQAPELTWLQNGFSGEEGMIEAHNVVLAALERAQIPAGKVYDPGCGNGLLLEKICSRFPQLVPVGVDSQRDRALAAKRRLQHGDFAFGNLHDPEVQPSGPFELVVLYPGRLLEEPNLEVRAATREKLLQTRWLLCYAYSDNLKRPLRDLMQEAGLPEEDGRTHTATPIAEAILVELCPVAVS